ncbi:MAG: C40 family peptidase [Clostridium sp.]
MRRAVSPRVRQQASPRARQQARAVQAASRRPLLGKDRFFAEQFLSRAAPTRSDLRSVCRYGIFTGCRSRSPAAVVSATRTAIVAYAKQFLGNPYVYGGTSLTNGADCSGFTQSVLLHFGITTGRSSRDQAARGKKFPCQPFSRADLLLHMPAVIISTMWLFT